jgi:hypothetical protein
MKNKTKPKEIDIHCACAIGDLYEMAALKPEIKSKVKIEKKTITKDELKKEDSSTKQ